MRSFKEFFYNEIKTAPKPPKPPSVGKGARVTGSGIQIPGVNFSQMGYGYVQPSGPTSLTNYDKDYHLEQRKTELTLLVKAAKSFQAIFLALNSGDPDEVNETKELYGAHIYTEGSLGSGAWIRCLSQSDGKGRGIMHRGIAKGYQFSAPELEWFKIQEILVSSKEQHLIKNDVVLDFNGDRIQQLMSAKGMGQNWQLWSYNKIDDILGRLTAPGRVTNQGTNLDYNA